MNTITTHRHQPWNKGKIVGQIVPFRLNDIWAIRVRLQIAEETRDLALFDLAIDSKLRACDLTKLRVRDVALGEPVSIAHQIAGEEEFSWDGTTGFSVSGVIVAKTSDGFEIEGKDLDLLGNATTGQILRGENLAYIDNANMAMTEWFGYRNVERLENGSFFISGFERGLIDTVAGDHAVGSRVWFVDQSPITSSIAYPLGSVQAKLLTYTNNDAMTEDESATLTTSVAGRYKLPVVPGRVMLNEWLAGNDVSASSTYRIRWSRRSSDYPGVVTENDPLDIAQAGVAYNVYVRQGGVNKVTRYGVSGNEQDIDGSLFVPGQIEILIEAVSAAGNSIVTRASNFNITP